MAFLSVIPGVSFFVSPFETDRAVLRAPLCRKCDARWTLARRILGGLVLLGVLLVALFLSAWTSLAVAVAIFATFAVRVIAGMVLVPRWTLFPGYIAADYVVVHDVADAARRQLLDGPARERGPASSETQR